MNFEREISISVQEALLQLYNKRVEVSQLSFQPTRKEFEGDITLVVFPLAKLSGKSPDQTGNEIGAFLKNNCELINTCSLVKGFLNILIKDKEWLSLFYSAVAEKSYGVITGQEIDEQPILVEYSSPNTNKPLHLGHIRNNLIGYSVAEILKANGKKVKKVNLVNDRGIHICKSMIAWQKKGNGETPQTTGIKGDHLVGKYYVEFDRIYKTEIAQLISSGMNKEEAEKKAPILLETQEMLRKWEAGDPDTISLWNNMNSWVYAGFNETYKMLGVDFDKFYFESETYLLGKKFIEKGLADGVFYKKDDGSVWIDLTNEGLDHKLVLRSDGTSVYITQDIGTANLRFEEYHFKQLIFVVANEQDYHFKVLELVLKKMGFPWSDCLFHLNYGMVDLPSGKMKSREGTVVDADELMREMIDTARQLTVQLGKLEGFTNEEAEHLYYLIGIGALKYFILKVDPDKKMLFNPLESIDFNGNTGPFLQYTYARICSVLRKASKMDEFHGFRDSSNNLNGHLMAKERELIITCLRFPEIVKEAGSRYSPALIANYCFELVKIFNQFYHENPIVDMNNIELSTFRLNISFFCSKIIKTSTGLLGIEVPERM